MGTFLFFLYNFLTPFIALIYLAFFILSPRRLLLKNLPVELKERLTPRVGNLTRGVSPVWIHAASVGELKAIKPVLEKIRKNKPEIPVLITTSTWSARIAGLKTNLSTRLIPLDFFPLMKTFIKKLKPRALILAETEIWPNLLCLAQSSGIKIFIVNGRLSNKSYGFYKLISPLIEKSFKNIEKALVQTRADAEKYGRFIRDTGKITITGNIKYDFMQPSDENEKRTGIGPVTDIIPVIEKLKWRDKPIFTAGSTHPHEEKIIIDSFMSCRESHKSLKLVIAPRHPETSGETAALLNSKGLKFIKWSELSVERRAESVEELEAVLVDEIGLLQEFYKIASVAFVGGTLVKIGGHNLLEPAMFSKPVLFGPDYRNAKEAGDALLLNRGGFIVHDAGDLSARLKVMISDKNLLKTVGENAKKTLESLQGATEKTIKILSDYL
ncbi:MAG: hypothetical protein HY746_07725 [Elusimicrobia bacterium]|nr:hypothetical protein [Elusimicrobiota bacterium]